MNHSPIAPPTVPAMRLLALVPILAALNAFAPLSTDMYLPGFAEMAHSFGRTDPGSIEITLSVFFVGLAVGQAVYGPLIDHYGRRRPLLFGIALYLAATFACLFVTRLEWFTALRLVQALGGCAGMIIGRAIVRDLFAPQEIARVFSLLMMTTIIAPIIAPILGGWMIAASGWPMVFAALLAFGAACFALVWRHVPETLPPSHRHPLSFGHTFRVYARLCLHSGFMVPALGGALAQSRIYAFITGSPFVFIEHFGVPAHAFGYLFGAVAFALIVSAQFNRMALKYWPTERILRWAMLSNCLAGFAVLGAAYLDHPWLLLAAAWISFAHLAFINPNLAALALTAAGRYGGSGSALVGVLQFAGAGCMSGLVALTQNGTSYPMTIGMAVSGLLALALWLWGQSRIRRRATVPVLTM